MNQVLFIVGMHRSGTSALAGSLTLAGAHVSQQLVPAAEDNPSGFWEDELIVNCQDELLFLLNSTWDSIDELSPDNFSRAELEPVIENIRTHVQEEYLDFPVSVIKDPRSCRLLPVWADMFEKFSITPTYILMLRSPWEVCQSLYKRDAMPLGKARVLWLRYVIDSIKHTKNESRLIIAYQDFLESPKHILREIYNTAAGPSLKNYDEALVEISNFLSEDLKHNSCDASSLTGADAILEDFYSRLIESRTDLPAIDILLDYGENLIVLYREIYDADITLSNKLDIDTTKALADIRLSDELEKSRIYAFSLDKALNKSRNFVDGLQESVDEKDNYLEDLKISIEEKDKYLSDIKTSLREKDQYVSDIKLSLEEKDQYLADIKISLDEKSQYLTGLKISLDEKNQYLTGLKISLDEKNQYADSLKKGIDEKDRHLVNLKASMDDKINGKNNEVSSLSDTLKIKKDQLQKSMEYASSLRAALDVKEQDLMAANEQIDILGNELQYEKDKSLLVHITESLSKK